MPCPGPASNPVPPSLSNCGCGLLTALSCPILWKTDRAEESCLIRKCLEGYPFIHPHIHTSWFQGGILYFEYWDTTVVSLGEKQVSLGQSRASAVQSHERLWRPHCLPLLPGRNSYWMSTGFQILSNYEATGHVLRKLI